VLQHQPNAGQDAVTATFHYANQAIAGQIGTLRKVEYNKYSCYLEYNAVLGKFWR